MNFWYSYDPEDGYTSHKSADEAREAAEASLEYHRDRSSDGWHENTSDIEWGLLVAYGEAREVNRRETPGGEHDYVCDYEICSSRGDPLEEAYRRLERSTDWYQQRFEALRNWVKREVEPLSHEVAHRYWAIVANGSPAPHEQADWKNTMHGLRLRAEQAERERDEARGERHEARCECDAAVEAADKLTRERDEARARIVELTEGAKKLCEAYQDEMASSYWLHEELQRTRARLTEQTGDRDEARELLANVFDRYACAACSHGKSTPECPCGFHAAGAYLDRTEPK